VAAAWRVSALSVAWTVLASAVAIGLGIAGHSVVLGAFGAVGMVDAVGSVALAHHFLHALHHEAFSDRLERRAHVIVTFGLLGVGVVTLVVSAARLATGAAGNPSIAGAIVAGASFGALIALSLRKRRLAAQVQSDALMSDSRLSAIGALQALVALAGVVTTRSLGWDWADAVAAMAVSVVAISIAVVTRPR
jgi:divalent metal cation (Fe/Co/Zn/Cd) transporter